VLDVDVDQGHAVDPGESVAVGAPQLRPLGSISSKRASWDRPMAALSAYTG
jgi:hypothetical protein